MCDAARELQHRFLAGDVSQQVRQRFERGQLAVCIEGIELRVIRGKGSVGLFGDDRIDTGGSGRRQRRKLSLFTGKQRVHCSVEQITIVGEIGDHVELIAKRNHADKIGGSHLPAEELFRCERGTRQIVGLQRSKVEEKNDHAAIALLLPNFLRRSN